MISLRTPTMAAELGWFSALCSDDYEYLGFPEDHLRSSYSHCKAITQRAIYPWLSKHPPSLFLPDRSRHPGLCCPRMSRRRHSAVERHSMWRNASPHARQSHQHDGSYVGGPPGSQHHLFGFTGMPHGLRRSLSPIHRSHQILQQAWTQPCIDFKGDFFNFQLDTQPVKTYQQNGGPLLYFGGYSSSARDLCARFCDVYLLWPDTQVGLKASMEDVAHRAAAKVDPLISGSEFMSL